MSKKTPTKTLKVRTRKIHIEEKKLGRHNALGFYEHVNATSAVIELDERLVGFQRLLILVHEAMHEICPQWTEEQVKKSSEVLAGIIWKCDYRHVDHGGECEPSYQAPEAKSKKAKAARKTYEQKIDKPNVCHGGTD